MSYHPTLDLVGRECYVVFSLDATRWPIPGYPAHVQILAVEMPLIKMVSVHGGKPIWVNASIVKTIQATTT